MLGKLYFDSKKLMSKAFGLSQKFDQCPTDVSIDSIQY